MSDPERLAFQNRQGQDRRSLRQASVQPRRGLDAGLASRSVGTEASLEVDDKCGVNVNIISASSDSSVYVCLR